MPSGHRTSPSSGRRPESDAEQRALDQLTQVNSQLNQALEEKEKYKRQLEQTKKRSSVSINTSSPGRQPTSYNDLQDQVDQLSLHAGKSDDECNQWKHNYKALQEEHSKMLQRYETELDELRRENIRLSEENRRLCKANDNLNVAYEQASKSITKLPERTKERAPKEYHSEDRRSREKDKSKKDKEDAKLFNRRMSDRLDPERGRGSGSGRERDTRPPKTKRRESYVEEWGPPARAQSRSRQTPRNAPASDPLRTAYGSGSGGSAIDDVEDGNYHAYTVYPSGR